MYVKSGDCKKYHQHLQIIPQHSNDFNFNSKKTVTRLLHAGDFVFIILIYYYIMSRKTYPNLKKVSLQSLAHFV